jgi:hypothetical protein
MFGGEQAAADHGLQSACNKAILFRTFRVEVAFLFIYSGKSQLEIWTSFVELCYSAAIDTCS